MPYLEVKRDFAPKTGLQAEGGITYAVLKDQEAGEVFLTLLANSGGGYFSRELVAFQRIEECLVGVSTDKPIPAKVFRNAFDGRSSNNAGFLVACLRHEALLGPWPEASHQHQLNDGWPAWKSRMLLADGIPYVPPETASEKKEPEPVEAVTSDVPAKGKGRKARKEYLGEHHHPDVEAAGAADADPA